MGFARNVVSALGRIKRGARTALALAAYGKKKREREKLTGLVKRSVQPRRFVPFHFEETDAPG